MASFSVLREQDPAGPLRKLVEIAPKNWHRFPGGVLTADVAPINTNDLKPRYLGAGAASDWTGAVKGGEDPGLPTSANMPFNTANYAIANSSGGANDADYAPRTQYAKAQALGGGGVTDVGRPRGPIPPGTAYNTGGGSLAAPTVTSVAPNTAAAGSGPLLVTITGTNFFPQSRVITGGGIGSPWDAAAKFIDTTHMSVVIDPRGAVAGAISIAVEDHSVLSNTDKVFTFT